MHQPWGDFLPPIQRVYFPPPTQQVRREMIPIVGPSNTRSGSGDTGLGQPLSVSASSHPCSDPRRSHREQTDTACVRRRAWASGVKELGSGGYGKVNEKTTAGLPAARFAEKVMATNGAGPAFGTLCELLVVQLRHPNIVGTCGFETKTSDGDPSVSMFMDVAATSVAAAVKNARIAQEKIGSFGAFNASAVLVAAYQMLSGVAELSRLGVRHCDIKTHNLLIFGEPVGASQFASALPRARAALRLSRGPAAPPKATPDFVFPRVVIADFGLSMSFLQPIKRTDPMLVYTLTYRAPELFFGNSSDRQQSTVNEATEVWACGCAIYEMFVGTPFIDARNDLEALQMIVALFGDLGDAAWSWIRTHRRRGFEERKKDLLHAPALRSTPQGLGGSVRAAMDRRCPGLHGLLTRMCSLNPDERPALREVLSSELFRRGGLVDGVDEGVRRSIDLPGGVSVAEYVEASLLVSCGRTSLPDTSSDRLSVLRSLERSVDEVDEGGASECTAAGRRLAGVSAARNPVVAEAHEVYALAVVDAYRRLAADNVRALFLVLDLVREYVMRRAVDLVAMDVASDAASVAFQLLWVAVVTTSDFDYAHRFSSAARAAEVEVVRRQLRDAIVVSKDPDASVRELVRSAFASPPLDERQFCASVFPILAAIDYDVHRPTVWSFVTELTAAHQLPPEIENAALSMSLALLLDPLVAMVSKTSDIATAAVRIAVAAAARADDPRTVQRVDARDSLDESCAGRLGALARRIDVRDFFWPLIPHDVAAIAAAAKTTWNLA
jgi:serine/threonine protein kinase